MTYRTLIGRHGRWLVLYFLIASVALACFLPRFEVDAGTHVLLNEDDPDLAYYNISRPDWSYDDYVIVCARSDDWFAPDSLALLTDLVAKLKGAPNVKSVTSILSVPLLRNRAGAFGLPNPILLSDPKVNIEKAREELLNHAQAKGNLISTDGRDLSILVYVEMPEQLVLLEPQWSRAQGEKDAAKLAALKEPYDASLALLKPRRAAMVGAVRDIAREVSPRLKEPVRLSGLPIIYKNLIEHVDADIRTFGVVSFALFTLAFLAVYRKPRFIALPILTCLLPVLLVVGAMAATGMTVTVITSNLPVLLFVLMLPYTVYFVERYRERRSLFPAEPQLDSTAGAAAEIWTPCLYSCITTMAGFASLLTSGINPVRTFGLMMTIGMAVGMACVFLFLPAASNPLRALEVRGAGTATRSGGVVKLLESAVLRSPLLIVLGSAALLAVAAWGTTRLKVETKFIDYFRAKSEVYQGLEYIDTRMGGTTPLEVILRSEKPGFFKSKEGLDAVEATAKYFDRVPETGNVRSLKTLLDEARKSIRNLSVDQLSKIKAAEEQVREFANPDFTVSRVLVRFRETAPTLHRNRILEGLRDHLKGEPALAGIEARPTGIFLLYANMLNSLIESQKDTFLMVVAAIYLMLLILFRSFVLSAIVLVPQVLPAFVCLGTMGWTGVPLDLVTVTIASIAMGVGIDAAIQYTVRFKIELAATGGDRRAAVVRSHATIGRAIWIATSIVVAGFIVLVLSKFVPTVYFGIFTALAMLMGQFAALTLLPALFLLFKIPRLRRS